MKAIIQRVSQAAVLVNQQIHSQIQNGILVLLGIYQTDTEKDLEIIKKKLLNLKIFNHWKQTITDLDYEILLVSQFTLCAKVDNGKKPDLHLAMKSEQAKVLYEKLIFDLKLAYKQDKIFCGAFGEMMQVSLVNEGPLTIQVDSNQSKEI